MEANAFDLQINEAIKTKTEGRINLGLKKHVGRKGLETPWPVQSLLGLGSAGSLNTRQGLPPGQDLGLDPDLQGKRVPALGYRNPPCWPKLALTHSSWVSLGPLVLHTYSDRILRSETCFVGVRARVMQISPVQMVSGRIPSQASPCLPGWLF